MSIPDRENPIELFEQWLADARDCDQISEPNAMTLATVDENGMPWPRIVLVKEVSDKGFSFYTNLGSPKAHHLRANPNAGLCFHWMPLDKQVRILGQVVSVDDADADAYFASRPRESQIGAWASRQSETMAERADLERRFDEVSEKFEGRDIPRPEFWSGFRLVPELIEFWLRAPSRLHHRRVYRRSESGWASELLYP